MFYKHRICSKGFIFHFFWILFLSSSLVSAEIKKTSPLIDQYALELQQDRFLFNSNGVLVEGPYRSVDDPADYSSILKKIYIEHGFIQTVMSCYEGISYCNNKIFRLPRKEIQFQIFHNDNFKQNEWLNRVHKILKNTYTPIGFNVIAEQDSKNVNLILFLGSKSYLSKKMESFGDDYGLKRIKHDQIKPFCYVSTKRQISEGQTLIFVNDEGIDSCLSRSLFEALGLRETALDIPSITDISGRYSYPTFVDHLFIKLLYDTRFNLMKDENTIRQYFEQKATEYWHEILNEDLNN